MSKLIFNNETTDYLSDEYLKLLHYYAKYVAKYPTKPAYLQYFVGYHEEIKKLTQIGALKTLKADGGLATDPELILHPFVLAATYRDLLGFAERIAIAAMIETLPLNSHHHIIPDELSKSKFYTAFVHEYPESVHSSIGTIPMLNIEGPVTYINICNAEQFTDTFRTAFIDSETRIVFKKGY